MADQHVETLKDKQGIRDLVYTYSHAADRRDYQLLATCFTPDLVFVIAGATYAANRDQFIYKVQGIERYHTTFHFNANHLAQIHGDTATAETYTLAHHFYTQEGRDALYLLGIRYLDNLVREDSRWLFKRREVVIDWEQGKGLTNPRRG